jgi:hypothetical protein
MNVLSMTKSLVAAARKWIDSCDEKRFVWFVLAAYIVLATANIVTHEMWRDELNPWMIAKDSHSLRELFHNLRYDGHPPLWYLMLYAMTRVTHNPAAMQYLHLTIAVASAYVFLRFAPFTRLQRLLFVFGYFPLYEYAAIRRAYAIGLLLIFVICAVYRAGVGKEYWLLAALLFLLAQTSAYGFLIVVSIAGTMVFEFLVDKDVRTYVWDKKLTVLLSVCLVLIGLAVSAVVMIPESDSCYAGIGTTRLDLGRLQQTLATVWQGYVPIPRLSHCYWNRNIFPGRIVPFLLAMPLLCFVLLLFARRRVPLVLFGSCTFLILSFQYFKYLGFLRHFGHMYIMFVVSLWFERFYGEDAEPKTVWIRNAAAFCSSRKTAFVTLLLVVNVIAGLHASAMEWIYPFSQAKNTARYIEQKGLDKLPILGSVDEMVSPVAEYLGRPIYYAASERMGTFILYDKKTATAVTEPTLITKAYNLAENEKGNVLLVLNYKLKGDYKPIVLLKAFEKSIRRDENFYLYLLKYPAE